MKVPVLACLVLLSACASSHMMIADDEAVLSVHAYSVVISSDDVLNQTLKDAAHLTLKRGYRYFVIETAEDASRGISLFVPGSSYSTGTATAYGPTAAYSGSTTYTPPHMVSGTFAGDRIQIKMFSADAQKPDGPRVYDAVAILGR